MRPERICDAHHHLWQREWSPYAVEDLRADLATVPEITSTVYIECDAWYRSDGPEHLRPVGETEWVVSHVDDVTRGIVGYADLRLPRDAVTEVLGAHVAAGAGRFRGIRQMAPHDPSPLITPFDPDPGPELLRDPRFRTGFDVLSRMGLTFDAWVFFPQLPEVVELAQAFPDTRIVLDHLGGPIGMGPYAGRRAEVLERWRPLMRDVAACPNVALKLGGIGMTIYGLGFHRRPTPTTVDDIVAAWGDEIRWCIETFGAERCMFESNFPVDSMSMGYATLWEAFFAMTADASAAERAALFHDNAVAVYSLGGDA